MNFRSFISAELKQRAENDLHTAWELTRMKWEWIHHATADELKAEYGGMGCGLCIYHWITPSRRCGSCVLHNQCSPGGAYPPADAEVNRIIDGKHAGARRAIKRFYDVIISVKPKK